LDWQFKKRLSISVAKAKYFVVLPLPYVLESHALLNGNFLMTLNSFDSDEAMKRGNEALNALSLLFLRSFKRFIASSLQILLSVKHFIAVNF
jgi:hypothetical protein